ncbi:transcriptional regulator (plasmid) [Methylorubrum populi]
MFVDELRRAVEAAPRSSVPELNTALWRAFGAGQVTEAEAEEISALIEARQAVPATPAKPARRVGSRPRTDASMERRRRWAASGRLPPAIAARFTLAEAAVLAVVTLEVVKRGDCRMHIDHIAAVAGVSRSTVKTALRQARTLGLLTVEERRSSAWRNLSNVVRIISREWLAWMRLARQAVAPGGGVKSPTGTNTRDLKRDRQRPAEALEEASEARKAGPPAPQSESVRFAEAGPGGSRSRASWS